MQEYRMRITPEIGKCLMAASPQSQEKLFLEIYDRNQTLREGYGFYGLKIGEDSEGYFADVTTGNTCD